MLNTNTVARTHTNYNIYIHSYEVTVMHPYNKHSKYDKSFI